MKSEIKWQTGIPTESGKYLITLWDGFVTTDIWIEDKQNWWQFYPKNIITWCPLKTITPFKEMINKYENYKNKNTNMTQKQKELVKLYKKYINFLSNSYADVFGIAHTHGYQCSDEDFEMGEKLRNAIKKLEEECGVPADDTLIDYLY
jgi:hypothetical protein